jgi:UDP-2-acetamido-3-amino-2,3-dideoxy-glucuronate N-acetyltransferase
MLAENDSDSRATGASLHTLPRFVDARGSLCVGEFASAIPFPSRRYFLVHGVPADTTRGGHAHRRCHQFLIAVSGSCRVGAEDIHGRTSFLLDAPHLGLHLPPMTWATQYEFSAGAVLLVFASETYDPEDYMDDYVGFLSVLRGVGIGR